MTSSRNPSFQNMELQQGELSEAESDASSVDSNMKPPSPASREQLLKRMESLMQENKVLKVELDALKIRVKTLQVENKMLKEASVQIQVKAEQEEEYISNTLLKKIQELKKEKEALALNYEQEEECLTNDLTRKLTQLRQEKEELASTLHQEQESMVGKLMRKIKKLEAETGAKQAHLEQLRREKIELENTLEQEQEALVNRLWKRMDKLETEKQCLQKKLDQPITAPPSPMDSTFASSGDPSTPKAEAAAVSDPMSLAKDIIRLRGEVLHLKQQLRITQTEHAEKTAQFAREEQQIREENARLQKKLQLEMERREQLCPHLSESESSLDMDEDRQVADPAVFTAGLNVHNRSSPMVASPVASNVLRPISPALNFGVKGNVSAAGSVSNVSSNSGGGGGYLGRCPSCGASMTAQCGSSGGGQNVPAVSPPLNSSPIHSSQSTTETDLEKEEKFVKPANPSGGAAPPKSGRNQSPSFNSNNSVGPGGESLTPKKEFAEPGL